MAVLELAGISKHFGAIQALIDVSLALHEGEVVGLMGDNGAGKSTLVKIVAGNYPPSDGTLTMGGRKVAFHKPTDAREQGIEIVYQDLALCDNLTAAVHMVVEGIFWFHPLVWWIGSRLVDERERACDEEVVRLGSEPQVYAESILKTCQFYVESPLSCVPGVTGFPATAISSSM